MSSTLSETRFAPRWLHAWAILTAGATVVLLALGAVVTTFQVGMADPVWPTMPWHLALIDWSEPKPGFVIEHVHRMAASVIGFFVIVLAVLLWLREPRRRIRLVGLAAVLAMVVSLAACFAFVDHGTANLTLAEARLCGFCVLICLASGGAFLMLAVWERKASLWLSGLGTVALAAVIFQGLLGGFRVKFNTLAGTDLAVIHGCFAQIVFSLLGSLVVVTSARFAAASIPSEDASRLRRWSLALTGLVFLQLIWGALLRHTNGVLAQRMHLLTAFAVVAVAVWFSRMALASPLLHRSVIVLGILLALQILLGIESWMGKFAGVLMPELHKPTIAQASTRVAHVLVGSFILATSVVLAVLAHRPKIAAATAAEKKPQTQTQASYNLMIPQLEGTA